LAADDPNDDNSDELLSMLRFWLYLYRGVSRPLSETPSAKPQAQEKFQISTTKPRKQMPAQAACRSVFELGAWCFFGAWNLGFGACRLGSQLLKN